MVAEALTRDPVSDGLDIAPSGTAHVRGCAVSSDNTTGVRPTADVPCRFDVRDLARSGYP